MVRPLPSQLRSSFHEGRLPPLQLGDYFHTTLLAEVRVRKLLSKTPVRDSTPQRSGHGPKLVSQGLTCSSCCRIKPWSTSFCGCFKCHCQLVIDQQSYLQYRDARHRTTSRCRVTRHHHTLCGRRDLRYHNLQARADGFKGYHCGWTHSPRSQNVIHQARASAQNIIAIGLLTPAHKSVH